MNPSSPIPPAPPPVAVLFSRFGPYHRARLHAAALLLRERTATPLIGIEVADRDRENPWVDTPTPSAFRSLTLFPGQDYRDLPPARIVAALDAALSRERPAAVAIPGWSAPEALAGLRWCRTTATPAILMSESSRHDAARQPWREWLKARIVRQFAAALVGGRANRDYAIALGIPASRVFLGYDAVDNDYFARGADAARANADSIRSQRHLPTNYFLASSRFIAKKNIMGLLDAFARYRARSTRPPWHLVLCGDGPLRADIDQEIQRLQLTDIVHRPGFVPYADLPDYYALAGAFVHASLSEQWGLVVNEALAAGLPVLVSRACGCAPDLVVEGRNGFSFDPTDTEALAALLLRMAEGNLDHPAMRTAARDHIAHWGPARFADGLTQALSATHLSPFRPLDRLVVNLTLQRATP